MVQLSDDGTVFVATVDGRVVGTASLDGAVVRTVFVAPDVQGHGVGKLLMAEIERAARERKLSVLTVPASITAESFYGWLEFRAVGVSYYGDERTIIVELPLD